MEPGWIATIIVVVINIFGWGVSWGRLNGRIKNLEIIAERHDKALSGNGVVQKIEELQKESSELKGTIRTYIKLHEKD